MSNGEKFLSIVTTYAGYCQICNEPRVVARIAVFGWPYQGAVCSRCLVQLADEVQRRGMLTAAGGATGGTGLPANGAGNGTALAATCGGNGHSEKR